MSKKKVSAWSLESTLRFGLGFGLVGKKNIFMLSSRIHWRQKRLWLVFDVEVDTAPVAGGTGTKELKQKQKNGAIQTECLYIREIHLSTIRKAMMLNHVTPSI